VTFCAEPGCLGLAAKGKFCDAHKKENYLGRRVRPENDRFYSLAAWRGPFGARGYKLRNSPLCEQVGCDKVATDVHHKDSSWKATGDFREFINQENLMSLCHEHHSEITLKEQQNGR
jgi:hypothetical protein